MSKIVVASTGRCGSTMMCDLLASTLNSSWSYSNDWHLSDHKLIKTHRSLTNEQRRTDFKAIFMWANFGDTIASMYNTWMLGHLKTHFGHLGVGREEIDIFEKIWRRGDKDGAYAYMIAGDKFNFKRIFQSWVKEKRAFLILYEHMIENPEEIRELISEHLGIELKPMKIKQRQYKFRDLPDTLQGMAEREYEAYSF